MLLAINIGNTNIRLGVFKGSKLVCSGLFPTHPQKTEKEIAKFLRRKEIYHVVIASVVPSYNKMFERVISDMFQIPPLFISTRLDTGMHIKIENPLELGADILCDIIATHHLYKGAVIVIDFGTATTFNAINKKGEYVGTSIAPGVQMVHDSLITKTALLHTVELTVQPFAIGINTTTAIQSGVVYGYIGLVEGLIKRFKKVLGKQTKVIATGGAARLIAPHVPEISQIIPDLTLDGIRILWERNNT